jgi:hypothetical protein
MPATDVRHTDADGTLLGESAQLLVGDSVTGLEVVRSLTDPSTVVLRVKSDTADTVAVDLQTKGGGPVTVNGDPLASGDVEGPASSVPGAIPVFTDSSGKVIEDSAREFGGAGGVATLDGSALVEQNPATATATPAASAIPIADSEGRLAAGFMRPEAYDYRLKQWSHDMGATTVSITGSAATFDQLGSSPVVAASESATGSYESQQTAASSGAVAGRASSVVIMTRAQNPILSGEILTATGVANIRLWFGWSSADLTEVTTPSSGPVVAAFRYDSTVDAGVWHAVCASGSGATEASCGVGIAGSTKFRFRIEYNAGSSEFWFYIDDVLVATIADDLPPTATQMKLWTSVTALTSTARRFFWSFWTCLSK